MMCGYSGTLYMLLLSVLCSRRRRSTYINHTELISVSFEMFPQWIKFHTWSQ